MLKDNGLNGASLVAQWWRTSLTNAGDVGSIPESKRSLGEGNGNPLQYSYPENPTDREAWQATVQALAGCQESDITAGQQLKYNNNGLKMTKLISRLSNTASTAQLNKNGKEIVISLFLFCPNYIS